MALTNSQLFRRFNAGALSGEANRMSIEQVGDLPYCEVDGLRPAATVVVGYGWAIYASRNIHGSVAVYEGWADWAREVGNSAEATPRHINGLSRFADEVSDDKPQCDDAPRDLVDQLKRKPRRGLRF